MTPGEIAVPPQIQTPEVLTALNKAFAAAGANPTSYQAGNPDQKINPETGAPEFGFFDVALPLGLSVLASVFGGPLIGSALGIAEGTGGVLGAIPSVLGGTAGSTLGSVITGKPLLPSLASGVGGAIGSSLLGGALGGFGTGPAGTPEVGPSAYAATGEVGDAPFGSAPAFANAATSSGNFVDRAIDQLKTCQASS